MTSKVYNKGNNRPLNTMDEIAYHELQSKYKVLEEKLGAYDKQVGGAHYKDMKVQPAQFINDRDYGPQESWIKGYNKWKDLKDKGVVSDKVKLGDLKKLTKKERCPHN